MASKADEKIKAMIRKAQGERSLREFALEMRVSAAYLSDILRGNRSPGKKVLQFFGIEKTRKVTVTYSYCKKKEK